jgi:hypothetical protein
MKSHNIERIAKVAAFVAGYLVLLSVAEEIPSMNSQRIESKAQLEQTVACERQRLRIDDRISIDATLLSQDSARSEYVSPDHRMILVGGRGANTSTVRHELYHIAHDNGMLVVSLSSPYATLKLVRGALYYLFYAEPAAVLYEWRTMHVDQK